jgi:5'-methylthioadenosine phosphorylase
MNGIISGTSLLKSKIFAGWENRKIVTPYGDAYVKISKNNAFIQRHGNPPVPPHKINHKANIWTFKYLDVRKVISINSVGSLKTRIPPGSFVVPHDFISLWVAASFYDKEMKFVVPEIDTGLFKYVCNLSRRLKMKAKSGGVYIQTIGPRLETKAEIKLLKRHGDIVGMTMPSEATLCMEYEIPYASICSVDNYCNGILKEPLTMEEINLNWQKNMIAVETFVKTLLERDFK